MISMRYGGLCISRGIKRYARSLLLLCTVLLFGASSVPNKGFSETLLNAPYFPLKDVKKGMHGVGYTVFEGQQRHAFEVEIVGVLKNYLGPKQDLIVARLLGDKIEFTGVIAGMSGSPVYIDGKLLGAVGYAFSTFAKEALAGITPIRNMDKIPKTPLFSSTDNRQHHAKRAKRLNIENERFEPIDTPLVISGVSQDLLHYFKDDLAADGFSVITAGGNTAASNETENYRIAPGMPVAGVLVSGDVSIAAVGTVTDVRDGRVLGFGHPFLSAGEVAIGMAGADILRVVASQRRSYKMSNVGPIQGTITEDRLTGISGELGKMPEMIPVNMEIDDGLNPKEVSYKVFRHVGLSPAIFNVALASSLMQRLGRRFGGTIEMEGKLQLEGHDDVTFYNIIADEAAPKIFAVAAMQIGAYFSAIWEHPFGAPPTVKINIKVKARPQARVEYIESVTADKVRVESGDELTLAIRVREHDGPVSTIHTSIVLPKNISSEKIMITAGSATSAETLERKISPNLRLTSFKSYLGYINELRRPGYIYIQLITDRPSISIGTDILHGVPASFALKALGAGDKYEGIGKKSILWEERIKRDGMVYGQALETVLVVPSSQ